MEKSNGEDEVGNGQNAEEIFQDAEDGNYFGTGKKHETRPAEIYAPVDKYATHYKMDHPHRGLALIFNHEVFECDSLQPRPGTDEDSKNLKDCLVQLGFDVQVFKDLNCTDLEDKIEQVSKMDHTDHDCILVAVLSHGRKGTIYAKDRPYKTNSLWSRFTADRCPTLAGKPKMFFLQVCQGNKIDSGVHLISTEMDGDGGKTYKIPVHADFLIVYSTVEGYCSWEKPIKGSWFIQVLCGQLTDKVDKFDLMTILTFVLQHVAIDFQSNVPHSITWHQKKQIPCVMSMLTRLIKFTNARVQ